MRLTGFVMSNDICVYYNLNKVIMDLKSNCEAVLDLVKQNLDIENVFEANGNKLMIGSSMFGFDNTKLGIDKCHDSSETLY